MKPKETDWDSDSKSVPKLMEGNATLDDSSDKESNDGNKPFEWEMTSNCGGDNESYNMVSNKSIM